MRRRIASLVGGIGAVGTKELRGRMRGWRAFLALTFYLALLAGFTVMVYLERRQSAADAGFSGSSPFVGAQVGQSIFTALMVLQVILVVFLAPAFTSGAISLEREKQTLDLLAATPVPTLAIVIGKLVSALAFVGILILASVPLVAVVFVFGGVAPDDILRGYLVLLVTGLGFGCVGLALSSITRRTQPATVLTYLAVLGLTIGTAAVFFLWHGIATPASSGPNFGVDLPTRNAGPIAVPAPDGSGTTTGSATTGNGIAAPPDWLVWLNPGVAIGDVICGAGTDTSSMWCRGVDLVLNQDSTQFIAPVPQPAIWKGGFVGGGGVNIAIDVSSAPGLANPGAVFVGGPGADTSASLVRDRIWPKVAGAWLVASLLLVAFSVLMVRPPRARRLSLRPRRPHLPRRKRDAVPEVTA